MREVDEWFLEMIRTSNDTTRQIYSFAAPWTAFMRWRRK